MAEILSFPKPVRPAPSFRRCPETGQPCTVAGQSGRIERVHVATGDYLVALPGRRACVNPEDVEVVS